jgi:uncharacterized protein YqeY
MGQLQQRIKYDLAHAISQRDNATRDYLKVITAELERGESKEKTDAETIDILKSLKKQANLLTEMSGISYKETMLLNNYIPQMMLEDEMKTVVHDIITLNNLSKPSDLGQVMKMVGMYGPTIDKKFCSSLAKELLAQ